MSTPRIRGCKVHVATRHLLRSLSSPFTRHLLYAILTRSELFGLARHHQHPINRQMAEHNPTCLKAPLSLSSSKLPLWSSQISGTRLDLREESSEIRQMTLLRQVPQVHKTANFPLKQQLCHKKIPFHKNRSNCC